MDVQKISFIWNADFSVAGGVQAIKDFVKGEESCSLCEIAYHKVRQTKEWKNYKKALKEKFHCEIEEPCKNQLDKALIEAANGEFPAVLMHTNQGIVKLLAGKAIDDCDGDFGRFQHKMNQAFSALAG